MRGQLLVALALVATTAACSSSGSSPSTSAGPHGTGATPALIAAAHLRPCPGSSPTASAGGLADVTLDCLGRGPAVHMAGLVGQPTVVNVWASWCGPCQAEEKYLSSAYNAVRSKVRFLGVDTVDQADSALDFDAHVTPPVRFPSVFDPDKKVLVGLHLPGPPETVYLDRAGHIVHVNTVPYRSTAQVKHDIATYLNATT